MKISGTSDSLLDYAYRLLSLAEREGAQEAEVFGIQGHSVNVDLRKNSVELASESFHCGLGLRAVVRGSVGFSSTSNMELLELVARSAVKSARARGSDDAWRSLPHPEKIVHPAGIYDSRLERIGPEECLDMAASLQRGCSEIKGAEPVSGSVGCVFGTDYVVNSLGIELQETSTMMHASMETIARAGDVATGSEFQNSRTLQPSLEDVGRAAAQMAKAS
ncbi:MAG: TldD/PmbA family protein, partial [Methanothrix sp.]|nr:TldD/PmbA family protein [Methanothrix sp.]